MNLYLFYFKPLDKYEKDLSTLYAFTNKKEIADDFKKQRDMDKFIYIKEEMDKDEYRLFCSTYSKMQLTYGKFYTASKFFGIRTPIKVLCTWREEESILKNSDDLWKEYSRYLFDCSMFKDAYLKALEKLLFIKFYGFYKIKYLENADYFYHPYYSSFGPPEGLIIEEFKESYSYDDLRLFLKFFQSTFKLENEDYEDIKENYV